MSQKQSKKKDKLSFDYLVRVSESSVQKAEKACEVLYSRIKETSGTLESADEKLRLINQALEQAESNTSELSKRLSVSKRKLAELHATAERVLSSPVGSSGADAATGRSLLGAAAPLSGESSLGSGSGSGSELSLRQLWDISTRNCIIFTSDDDPVAIKINARCLLEVAVNGYYRTGKDSSASSYNAAATTTATATTVSSNSNGQSSARTRAVEDNFTPYCQYELLGTCNRPLCPFQHFSSTTNTNTTGSTTNHKQPRDTVTSTNNTSSSSSTTTVTTTIAGSSSRDGGSGGSGIGIERLLSALSSNMETANSPPPLPAAPAAAASGTARTTQKPLASSIEALLLKANKANLTLIHKKRQQQQKNQSCVQSWVQILIDKLASQPPPGKMQLLWMNQNRRATETETEAESSCSTGSTKGRSSSSLLLLQQLRRRVLFLIKSANISFASSINTTAAGGAGAGGGAGASSTRKLLVDGLSFLKTYLEEVPEERNNCELWLYYFTFTAAILSLSSSPSPSPITNHQSSSPIVNQPSSPIDADVACYHQAIADVMNVASNYYHHSDGAEQMFAYSEQMFAYSILATFPDTVLLRFPQESKLRTIAYLYSLSTEQAVDELCRALGLNSFFNGDSNATITTSSSCTSSSTAVGVSAIEGGSGGKSAGVSVRTTQASASVHTANAEEDEEEDDESGPPKNNKKAKTSMSLSLSYYDSFDPALLWASLLLLLVTGELHLKRLQFLLLANCNTKTKRSDEKEREHEEEEEDNEECFLFGRSYTHDIHRRMSHMLKSSSSSSAAAGAAAAGSTVLKQRMTSLIVEACRKNGLLGYCEKLFPNDYDRHHGNSHSNMSDSNSSGIAGTATGAYGGTGVNNGCGGASGSAHHSQVLLIPQQAILWCAAMLHAAAAVAGGAGCNQSQDTSTTTTTIASALDSNTTSTALAPSSTDNAQKEGSREGSRESGSSYCDYPPAIASVLMLARRSKSSDGHPNTVDSNNHHLHSMDSTNISSTANNTTISCSSSTTDHTSVEDGNSHTSNNSTSSSGNNTSSSSSSSRETASVRDDDLLHSFDLFFFFGVETPLAMNTFLSSTSSALSSSSATSVTVEVPITSAATALSSTLSNKNNSSSSRYTTPLLVNNHQQQQPLNQLDPDSFILRLSSLCGEDSNNATDAAVDDDDDRRRRRKLAGEILQDWVATLLTSSSGGGSTTTSSRSSSAAARPLLGADGSLSSYYHYSFTTVEETMSKLCLAYSNGKIRRLTVLRVLMATLYVIITKWIKIDVSSILNLLAGVLECTTSRYPVTAQASAIAPTLEHIVVEQTLFLLQQQHQRLNQQQQHQQQVPRQARALDTRALNILFSKIALLLPGGAECVCSYLFRGDDPSSVCAYGGVDQSPFIEEATLCFVFNESWIASCSDELAHLSHETILRIVAAMVRSGLTDEAARLLSLSASPMTADGGGRDYPGMKCLLYNSTRDVSGIGSGIVSTVPLVEAYDLSNLDPGTIERYYKTTMACLHGGNDYAADYSGMTCPDGIFPFTSVAVLHTCLRRLYLKDCGLVALPIAFREFENLTTLDLTGNRLSELPGDMPHRLPALKQLVLSKNVFAVFPPVVLQLKKLELLDLSYNRIEYLPNDISSSMPALHSIDVSSNPLRSVTNVNIANFKL